MAVAPVTPVAGLTSVIAVGGTAVVVANGGVNGGYITNPASATESLFVDAVGSATLVASGTTFELQAGMTWPLIPGQTTQTTANAATTGHAFSVVLF